MNYAVGCAFNLDNIFDNFKYKKLNFNCEKCKEITGDPHRKYLVKRIFRECFKLIIKDIIENNITFWLPTGSRQSCLKMKRVRGDAFKNLRRFGKWKDVDFLQSNFTGHEIGFFMFGNRTPRVKNVYLNTKYKNRITEKTNQRMNYGDSINDKYIKDYYEIVHSLFPDVTISDIKRILNFGWKSLYLHNSYGGDTLIRDNDMWCYIGFLKKDPIKHYLYYIKKTCVKLRVLYKRYKIPWDGYYYFALSNQQYEYYLSQQNKRGRPKKNFKFINVFLYQLLDECKLAEHEKRYIFRIPYISTIKFKFYIPELITNKAEQIITRSPIKFNDIIKIYEEKYNN